MMQQHLNVSYLYQELETGPEGVGMFPREALRVLPPGLLFELGEAVEMSDPDQITQAIRKIAGHDVQVAKALDRLANDFEFDGILDLLQS